jgi:tripartite-type tricarboxylate transporter receptor subunit TctC
MGNFRYDRNRVGSDQATAAFGGTYDREIAVRQALNALLTALAFTGVHANHADAQSYPSRPITMVVPFAAGGGTDTLGRIIAEGMKASLGQPVIVENLPGAAGSVALSRVSRAAPDGYTIVFGNWATHVVGPAMHAPPYDVIKDFVPISLAATQPLVVIANKSVPANDLRELVAWVKANPDKATVGTAGPGSATHVAGLFFQAKTGARVQLVPYRGGGTQSMQDLIGGHVNLAFTQASNALPYVQAGEIRAYAVTASARLATAQNIPTVDEAGVPGRCLGSQGHSGCNCEQAQRRSRQDTGRSRNAQAAGRHQPGTIPAGPAHVRGLCRVSCSRDCDVVADYQGVW